MHILGVSISLQRGEQAYTTTTTGVVDGFLDIFGVCKITPLARGHNLERRFWIHQS